MRHWPDFTPAEWLLNGLLGATVLMGLGLAVFYFLRRSGTRASNHFLAALLLVFSLSLIRIFFSYYQGPYPKFRLYFLPFWCTLAIGPFYFYFIKFRLFPAYQFRWTDAKHFFLPVAQFIFLSILAFLPAPRQAAVFTSFVLPYYKTFEGGLFIISFFGYGVMAYRYVRYMHAVWRWRGFEWQRRQARRLRRWTSIFLVLGGINTAYVVLDFLLFNGFGIDLLGQPAWRFWSDLSLLGMLWWLLYLAYRQMVVEVLFTKPQSGDTELYAQFKSAFFEQERYRDPALNRRSMSRVLGTSPVALQRMIRARHHRSFDELLREQRLALVRRRRNRQHLPLDVLALDCGFPSRAAYRKAADTTNHLRTQSGA